MKSKSAFNPATDIPSLAEHVYFITGGTSGLGKETILALSQHAPKHIYFSGRSSKSATGVISQIKATNPAVKISFLECDQTSLSSTENAVKKFLSDSQRLDVLICNAGVMGTDPSLTKDGYEYQFGINHVAHALLVKMLLPSLQRTAAQTGDARIVFVSSVGFRYGQSKLANVVYAAELARRYPEITSVSIHPGVIWTNLWNPKLSLLNRIFVYLATLGQAVPPEEGVLNSCWAITTQKENLTSGAFYEPVGVIGSQTKNSENLDLSEQLWTWTQKELENFGQ